MPSKVVVGVQWGDEGKGKVIDILASRADVVVRAQGGNNAGHTVKADGKIYRLRLVPSGILYPGTSCMIGCGVVIHPASLLEEIEAIEKQGVPCDRLRIDPRAHVVMPWHISLDSLSEKYRGKGDIGTTGRGIGPCYMDKAERSGLRIYDLVHPDLFAQKARQAGELKNAILSKVYGASPLDIEAIIREYSVYGEKLKKYLADVSVAVYEAYKAGKEILFEGAQGTMLDIDMGTYPYVTSSHPLSGGVCTGTGIGPGMVDSVVGVAKAYTTRVGKGIFPTELFDTIGDQIRECGKEFGTNTGRPRRIGWFDSVLMRHAVRVNGLNALAMNKLDVLQGIDPLKICVAYQDENGEILKDYPVSLEELAHCKPIYEEIKGFHQDISGCTSFEQLPGSCQSYIRRLEELCECPIQMVGVGPARDQNLER